MLGPLNASEYQVGDIFAKRIPIISSSQVGLGFSVSNRPVDSSLDGLSNTITLRGELPVGFQVDVMRNGELLDFISEPNANGEYVFEELVVFSGLNVFELVFYGPQGQVERKEERIFIPDSALKKGAFEYEASVSEDLQNLFTSRETSDPDAGELRASIQTQYGLTDNVSISSALSSYSIDGERQDYMLLGTGFSFAGIRFNMLKAFSSDDGKATSFRAQSNFKGYRWQLQHEFYNDFTSEETQESSLPENVKHETNFTLSGLLPIKKLRNIPFTLNFDRFEDVEGNEQIDWNVRVTNSLGKLRLTSEFNQMFLTDRDPVSNFNFQVSSRVSNKFRLRGQAQYEIQPETALSAINLTADYTIDDWQDLRLGFTRSGAEDPVHNVTAGYSRDLGFANVGANLTVNDQDEYFALLTATFGLGYNKYDGPYISSQRLANTGAIAPRVFIDKNANLEFDDEDEPLEGIKFKGTKQAREQETSADGTGFVGGYDPYSRNVFSLDTATFGDPFIKPLYQDADYDFRPSQIVYKDFPLGWFGEVDGNIYLYKNGIEKPASSILVEVYNIRNELAASARSEYDGFLLIQDVPIGEHTVKINEEQIQKLGYCPVDPQSISMTEEEPFATIDDITLYPSFDANPDQVWLRVASGQERSGMDGLIETLKEEYLAAYEEFFDKNTIYMPDENDGNEMLVLGSFKPDEAKEFCSIFTDLLPACQRLENLDCSFFESF